MPALAEDLLQLLIDDNSGRPVVEASYLDSALAGAVLLELVRSGRVVPSAPEGRARQGMAVVQDDSDTGDPVLNEALARLTQRPLTFGQAVEMLVKGTREAVLDCLVQRGVLRYEQSRVLGIFRTDSWRVTDGAREDQLRVSLRAVLFDGGQADDNTAALIALLQAVKAVRKVMGDDDATSRARVREIVKSHWADEAVYRAVMEVYTAVEKKAAALMGAVAAAAAAG